jgi:2-polyprenyl-3-methyl-5-hydroxy-6-metoxy-1,4-benzoquinol methylase
LLQLPRKVAGYLFFEDSYEKYYSSLVWNQRYKCNSNFWDAKESSRYASIVTFIREYAHGGAVLDAGCGDGLLEEKCRSLESPILGIDYSCVAITKARQRQLHNCEFICADARTFFIAANFSTIVFNESLYYIGGYLESLRRLIQLLQQNGVFIISMYDTRITRRIWKRLELDFHTLSEVRVRNGASWTIRVIRPHMTLIDPLSPSGAGERVFAQPRTPLVRDGENRRTKMSK